MDIETFDSQKILEFIRFCNLFMKGKVGNERFSCPPALVKSAFKFVDMPAHPFSEFVKSIPATESDPAKFRYWLEKYMKQVLDILAENPSMITPELQGYLERNPNYKWVLQSIDTAIVDPAKVVADSLIKTVALLSDIANSIKKTDLRKLDTKEKIGAIKQLSFVYDLLKKYNRPSSVVFNQINVNNAKPEDLEGALLRYVEGEQETVESRKHE